MNTRLSTLVGSYLVMLGIGLIAEPTRADDAVRLAQNNREAVITITASYPGASAEVVADSVAAPIEQQVNGVDAMVSLSSTSKNDGSYFASIAFKPETDLARALVLVQNRVSLAVRQLPESVTNSGISVRAKVPGVLMFVAVTSPNGRYNTKYLGDYAHLYLKDELVRVAGVGDVAVFGQLKNRLRLDIDSKALEARKLTVSDVVTALRKSAEAEKKERTPVVSKKGVFQLTIPGGRFWMPEMILDEFLKAGGRGRAVRLKDVAKVEIIPVKNESQAIWNGHPAICLAVWSIDGDNCRKNGEKLRRRLRELEKRFPVGMRLDIAYDCTKNLDTPDKDHANPYFAFDVDVLKNASARKSGDVLTRCNSLLRDTKKVADILAITESPFDRTARQPWILARSAQSGENKDTSRLDALAAAKLEQDGDVRVRRPVTWSHQGCLRVGYPFAVSLHGPDFGKVSQWAKKMLVELNQEKKLKDSWIDAGSMPTPQPRIEINRIKLAVRGMNSGDVVNTIGVLYDQEVTRFGPWPVILRMDGKSRPPLDSLLIRDGEGKLLPLGEVATVGAITAPRSIHRVDLQQCIPITANAAAGVSLEDAQIYFARVADRVRNEQNLPATYGMTWLTPR